MTKTLGWLGTLVWMVTLAAFSAAQTLTGVVRWNQPTGKKATAWQYGLNTFQGFDPAVAGTPGNPDYRRAMEAMHPGMIRYHRWDAIQDSTTNANGWIVSPTTAGYAWDAAKIDRALTGAFAYGPARMINIVSWPAFLDDGKGRLRSDKTDAFARYCAALVRIINVEQKRGIRYWEITNEKDGVYEKDMGSLARIINAASMAMKLVDPAIKVGGPAFARPDKTAQVQDFLSVACSSLDFLSYHTYSTGDKTASNQSLWDSAGQLGQVSLALRALLAKHTKRTIEMFHDEYNISWDPPDAKMTTMQGAIFDALAMLSFSRAGVTGAMAWNEADGWYGKLDGAFHPRPAAYVYQLFNAYLTGDIVESQSDNPTKVVLQAVRQGKRFAIVLVNRSEADQTMHLTFSGETSLSLRDRRLMLKRVQSSGLISDFLPYRSLAEGFLLPANTVTLLIGAPSESK